MTQLYAQPAQQGIWTCLGPPTSAAFALGQPLSVTYGDGTQDTLVAHVPAVTSAGTTQVDRTGAVWLLYVVAGDPTLRIVREMDQGTIAGSYAPLARVLADRVVPYQPDNGQAQSSTSGQSFLPLTVTNNSSTSSIGGSVTAPVAAGSTDYVVQCHLSGSVANAVWNALSDKTAFSDLQVLFAGAEIDADLDTQTNGPWSSSNITLWFRLQRPISASASDQGYQLRLGGGLRSSPKRSLANIYGTYDDFLGSSLAAGWTVVGSGASVTVGSSVVQISQSAGLGRDLLHNGPIGLSYQARYYVQHGSSGTYEVYVQAASSGAYGPSVGVNTGTVAGHWTLEVGDGAGYSTPYPVLGGDDTSWHVLQVARDAAGHGYGASDGTSGVVTDKVDTATNYLRLHTNWSAGAAASLSCDWVKVHPFVSPEPSVSAGALQSAGPLRWEPVVDSTGSVLIAPGGDPIMALVAG